MGKLFLIVQLIFIVSLRRVLAWDSEELEIFDLVEDINQNFYTILKVEQTASLSEIKRAFRSLSVILHPDKNDAEDANIQFRNLVSVYEVLKDPSKRAKYDKVLRDGLPNWKSALYYYRRVRKMGLAEMATLLFVIITIGQYIIAWAAYAEKKYTAETLLGSKLKKMQKKNKTLLDINTVLNSIPAPSIRNTLPFQIIRGMWYAPATLKQLFNTYADYKEDERRKKELELETAEEQRILEERIAKEKEARKEGARKRKTVFKATEKTEEELKGYSTLNSKANESVSCIRPVTSKEPVIGGIWTDDDLAELARLVKKFPIGTLSRWEIIAEQMNRSVSEITFMAARLKENGYRQNDSVAESLVQETVKKVKRIAETNSMEKTLNASIWSQDQQKLLESAIIKYPKNLPGDRWQKIANNVPGKTKEECLGRYKHLVELVKAQKSAIKNCDSDFVNNGTQNRDIGTLLEVVTGDKKKQDQQIEDLDRADGIDEEFVIERSLPDKKPGGKPKNKRKERKNRMEFSSDDDEIIEDLVA